MLAAVTLLAVVSTARSQEVVVLLVNGQPITASTFEQRSKFMELSSHKAPSPPGSDRQPDRRDLELHEAKRFGIEPTDADVEQSYANVASRMGFGQRRS